MKTRRGWGSSQWLGRIKLVPSVWQKKAHIQLDGMAQAFEGKPKENLKHSSHFSEIFRALHRKIFGSAPTLFQSTGQGAQLPGVHSPAGSRWRKKCTGWLWCFALSVILVAKSGKVVCTLSQNGLQILPFLANCPVFFCTLCSIQTNICPLCLSPSGFF